MILYSLHHRVHRTVKAAFWRTFHHEGKISLAGNGGGCSKVAVYAPAEWADTQALFHPISSLPIYVLCGLHPGKNLDTKIGYIEYRYIASIFYRISALPWIFQRNKMSTKTEHTGFQNSKTIWSRLPNQIRIYLILVNDNLSLRIFFSAWHVANSSTYFRPHRPGIIWLLTGKFILSSL